MAGQGLHTDDDWRPRPAERSYTFGEFCLLPDRQVLLKDAQPVALGSRAFDILTLLVQRAGKLVSNGEIEAYAWPATYVHESNVKVHIAALRKTLRGAGDDGRAILNVPGRGYCFAGPVKVEGRARPSAARATAARAAAPTPSTSVIGREDEIAALADLVAQHSLVTIVGAGGVGKTTLAWAAADRLAGDFDAPPCFVDLASIDDPQLVVDAIAAALGVRVDLNDVLGGIAAHLRETARLVILDNCEHLTAAVAAVADQLATGAGRSSLLATSREPLRARREMAWRLAPLACPAADAPITAALALNYSAVALFSARAGERAGYVPTDEDAATVGAICRRLDGVPLALELAATRLDRLSPADLLELLQISLAPLGQDDVATPIRHRTLLATLDWSYRLLSDTGAAILRFAAIFAREVTVERYTDFGGTLHGSFAAHPHLDPLTGELLAVCYDVTNPAVIRHVALGPDGQVRREVEIAVEHGPMIHDCAFTARFVIILDLPVTFSPELAADGHPFPYAWNAAHAARVGLLPREGGAGDVIWCPIEPCYVFHAVNAFDAADGSVILDVPVHDRMFSTSRAGPDSRRTGLERWTIDPATRAVTRVTLDPTPQEFPRPDERRLGQPCRYAYTMAVTGPFLGERLFKQDLETGVRLAHDFGAGRHPCEFIFLPAHDAAEEDEGWLMGFVIDAVAGTTDLVILDARDFEGPPRASIRLPHVVPPGFHGNWLPT